jgi:hypothetical protein
MVKALLGVTIAALLAGCAATMRDTAEEHQ